MKDQSSLWPISLKQIAAIYKMGEEMISEELAYDPYTPERSASFSATKAKAENEHFYIATIVQKISPEWRWNAATLQSSGN